MGWGRENHGHWELLFWPSLLRVWRDELREWTLWEHALCIEDELHVSVGTQFCCSCFAQSAFHCSGTGILYLQRFIFSLQTAVTSFFSFVSFWMLGFVIGRGLCYPTLNPNPCSGSRERQRWQMTQQDAGGIPGWRRREGISGIHFIGNAGRNQETWFFWGGHKRLALWFLTCHLSSFAGRLLGLGTLCLLLLVWEDSGRLSLEIYCLLHCHVFSSRHLFLRYTFWMRLCRTWSVNIYRNCRLIKWSVTVSGGITGYNIVLAFAAK